MKGIVGHRNNVQKEGERFWDCFENHQCVVYVGFGMLGYWEHLELSASSEVLELNAAAEREGEMAF